MAFTTSGQETEWALFLQPRSPHGAGAVRKSVNGLACRLHVYGSIYSVYTYMFGYTCNKQ